jgi:hypothetical protein
MFNTTDIQNFRENQVQKIPKLNGLYILRDWFKAPLYSGASKDTVRSRVRRHLTSARSDLISSCRISVNEIAYVDFFPVADDQIDAAEKYLTTQLNAHRPLFNSQVSQNPDRVEIPQGISYQILPTAEILRMKNNPILVLSHQATMLKNVIDYTINVKNNEAMNRAIKTRTNFYNYHLKHNTDYKWPAKQRKIFDLKVEQFSEVLSV